MNIYFEFILIVLAVWRISYLISSEDGPFDAVLKLRQLVNGTMLANLMDCFYCVSLWVAIPFAVLITDSIDTFIIFWFAISGLACIIHKFIPNA